MINKSYFLCFAVLILFCTGCKDDPVVQNTNNNTTQDPTAPELSEPVNNSVVTVSAPLLKWNPFPNTISYRVQVSFDANFLGIMFLDTGVTSSEVRIRDGLLTTGVNFYWRVQAVQNSNNSNWSPVWLFSIILSPPTAPFLQSPPDNSTSQSFTPLFNWDDSPTAQTYRLQISENSSFSSILYDSSRIPVSELQCPSMVLNTGTEYYWRVNASNSNGLSTGDWSVSFHFSTVNGPEPNSISGTITFVDNNFIHFPNFYAASAFSSLTWPPLNVIPTGIDSLTILQSGNTFTAAFKIRHLPNGTYYLANSIIDRVNSGIDIYGTYGCDTNRIKFSNCAFTPTQVTISENNGVTGINFLSWADSTRRIFN